MRKRKVSLNRKLLSIALASFIPLMLVLLYALFTLNNATRAYSKITYSVTYANQAMDFKERMDYSMYLAVVRKKDFKELGTGEITVNGIVTVNPYEFIDSMKEKSQELSDLATVDINKNQVIRLQNTLDALERNVETLEDMIHGDGNYEDNMTYLDENIYMLTEIIQDGIQAYIRTETENLQDVRIRQEQQNQKLTVLCIYAIGMAAFIAVVMTWKAVRSVAKPIENMAKLTGKVAGGDFTRQAKEADILEIDALADSFNSMTREIGQLIADIKEKEKNLHLMETKLLQAQINPHFLYNTLDAIVWLAEDNRNEEAIMMVTSLSDFFRTTLANGRDFITVSEEESHIESYLKIQRFRYEDIMDYKIEIAPEMKQYVIPKLLLQPLVENALYHGVKMKRGRSEICVRGVKEEERLIFTVEDDGKGMSPEKLEALRQNIQRGLSQKETDSFGLANIHQRIRHYYGEAYGLSIESRENEGTKATIIIPAKENESFS